MESSDDRLWDCGRALAGGAAPRPGGGRRVLLFGGDDRRLLPAVLRRAPAAARRMCASTRPAPRPSAPASGRASAAVRTGRARGEHAAAVATACRLIAEAEELPSLAALAAAAGLSRFHFHRVFKAMTGVTPAPYAAQNRAQRVRAGLRGGGTVTAAIYDAGFNSSGRFYAAAPAMLGMTPQRFRAGGRGAAIRFAVGQCSLGAILVAATDKGVAAILLGDDPAKLVARAAGPLSQGRARRRRRGFERLRREGRGLRRDARRRSRPAARRARHRVPAARVAGAARASPPARPRPMARSRAASARPTRCARSARPAPPTRSRSPSPATAWCASTAGFPAIAGASSASARCWSARRRHDALRPRDVPRAPTASPRSTGGSVEAELDADGYAVLTALLAPDRMRRARRAL